MRQWKESLLLKIMIRRLLTDFQLDPWEQTWVKFDSNLIIFIKNAFGNIVYKISPIFCWDVLTYPLTTKRTSPKVMLTRSSIFISSEVCWANLRDHDVCAVLRMWRLFFNNPFRPGSRKVVYCLHWKWMSQRNHDKMSTHDVSRYFVRFRQLLTHWGWMTQKCVSKLTIIGSGHGLSPVRHQAIIWTNAGILLTRPWGQTLVKSLS